MQAEARFDSVWLHSGLGGELGKRATAGLSAPKFDPEGFVGEQGAIFNWSHI